MQVKVSELTDDALDWAVAKCAGRTLKHRPMGPQGGHGWWIWEETPSGKGGILIDKSIYMQVGPRRVPKTQSSGERWSPSTDWAQGGPIIESVGISVNGAFIGGWEATLHWSARAPGDEHKSHHAHNGPSPLVAAMRCFVASRLGSEIEIPGGLTFGHALR